MGAERRPGGKLIGGTDAARPVSPESKWGEAQSCRLRIRN